MPAYEPIMNPEEEQVSDRKFDVYNDTLASAVAKHILIITDNRVIAMYNEIGDLLNIIYDCK